ncbi:hypothetical protein LEP1GSC038_3058 [Leptospira weilii str. 2006001855]|uniref:Uncharacterized protein n=1 Tax=Leptospira weilii str. 2006001855 TaxID=996804 RepID=M6FJH8_9LEPT|nr:hypothetical protein LEP1GSC038_3058 [Leptospira weilii str. 2006001855]
MNPVLFLEHGSPLVTPSDFTRSLEEFGSKLGGVENILVLSAHWKTRRNVCDRFRSGLLVRRRSLEIGVSI